MTKIIYLLLFIFDIIFTPIVIIVSYIGYSLMLMYFCLKHDNKVMDEMINYNKWFVTHIASTFMNGMKVHKKRILGD